MQLSYKKKVLKILTIISNFIVLLKLDWWVELVYLIYSNFQNPFPSQDTPHFIEQIKSSGDTPISEA